jgi:hypothetical protein
MSQTKKLVLAFVVGLIVGISYFLISQERQIIVVEKPVTKEVEKIVYIQAEPIEKIVYKKRSCHVDKEKICSEYILELEEQQKQMNGYLDQIQMVDEQILQLKTSYSLPVNNKNNRINLLVGAGKVGYSTTLTESRLDINPINGSVFGLQYERKFKKINGSILIQNNSTVSIGVGLDF